MTRDEHRKHITANYSVPYMTLFMQATMVLMKDSGMETLVYSRLSQNTDLDDDMPSWEMN